MINHLAQYIWWQSNNMRAQFRGIDYMKWMPDTCDENFGLVRIISENRNSIPYDVHSDFSNVIQPTDKGTDKTCPSFGCEESLIGRKNQSYVCFDTFDVKLPDGPQAL